MQSSASAPTYAHFVAGALVMPDQRSRMKAMTQRSEWTGRRSRLRWRETIVPMLLRVLRRIVCRAGEEQAVPDQLPADFPSVLIDASWGQWWRIHGEAFGPWWFESSNRPGRKPKDIGRFDLPLPHGTCYLGSDIGGISPEVLRQRNVGARDAQVAASKRVLSQMPLDRYYGQQVADFAAEGLKAVGAPADVGALSRAAARPWASVAQRSGYHGILFRLHADPQRRRGLALFDHAGARDLLPHQPQGTPLTVGQQHELRDLFGGAWSGDDPLSA